MKLEKKSKKEHPSRLPISLRVLTDDGRTIFGIGICIMVPITRSISLLAFLHFCSVCSVDLEVLTPLVIVDKLIYIYRSIYFSIYLYIYMVAKSRGAE